MGDALSVGDHALRVGMLDLDAVRAHAHHLPPRLRGRKHALLAVSEISPLRESPLESWSWARFLEWGLPRPRMQVRIDDHGLLIGVVDFLWDDVHLIGECDGAMKYRQPGDLYREKRREDELRGLGFGVIRWGWSDAAEGARLRRRLERALSSATAHVA